MKFGNSGVVFEGTQNQIKLFANVIVRLISTISLLSTLQMFYHKCFLIVSGYIKQ